MMGRSHLVLAGAAYAALSLRPIETPYGTLAAPLLDGLTDDWAANLLVSWLIAASCGLAPDIDKGGSTASRSLGAPTRLLSWGIERSFGPTLLEPQQAQAGPCNIVCRVALQRSGEGCIGFTKTVGKGLQRPQFTCVTCALGLQR